MKQPIGRTGISPFEEGGSPPSAMEYPEWRSRWMAYGNYTGSNLPDPDRRIDALIALWRMPVPGNWQRNIDAKLLGPRYRRGDGNAPHAREHRIEHDLLAEPINAVTCLGAEVVDGVNAVPLARDPMGGRSGNVEADVLLLLRDRGFHRIAVLEVKDGSNNAWYAAVENLLQMRLFSANPEQRRLFHVRLPDAMLDEDLPVMGLVAAPPAYYSNNGQKALAVDPARHLQHRFRTEVGVDVHLATWDAGTRTLTSSSALR